MNIRLWELDNGDLIKLDEIFYITKVYKMEGLPEIIQDYMFDIWVGNVDGMQMKYRTEDEAKLARFKIIERWNACLDMIYSQTWCAEAGTHSSSSKPIEEDNFEGYRESEH